MKKYTGYRFQRIDKLGTPFVCCAEDDDGFFEGHLIIINNENDPNDYVSLSIGGSIDDAYRMILKLFGDRIAEVYDGYEREQELRKIEVGCKVGDSLTWIEWIKRLNREYLEVLHKRTKCMDLKRDVVNSLSIRAGSFKTTGE